MPYHMDLFGVSALEGRTRPARPWYSRWLRFLDRHTLAASRRKESSSRGQARKQDDIFTVYPPALADLKRRNDGGVG